MHQRHLSERLAEVRASAANEELDPYARDVMTHVAEGVELDLAWIDTKLTTERDTVEGLAHKAR